MTPVEATSPQRWTSHPWRARGVRVLVYALPVALSLLFVRLATSVVSAPTGSLAAFLLWWLALSLGATVVVSLVYALSRRLLPLGALLELSLVFPDAAPSRFQLALRTGTVETLEERLRLMRQAKDALSAQEAAEILLRLVAALSIHDSITRGHAERVRAYAYMLGQQLGLGSADLDRLNWAALLHDVGKLEVSAEILNKQGKPTEAEWESLRLHPTYGEALVKPLREWLGAWIEAVGHHHERWDGHGYPRGLAGEEIPVAGRIVAIADVFDVITSARSYKEPAGTAEARSEIVRCSGAQFDPRLVRAFVAISLDRMRLVLGPVAWLTHAPLLARVPLTPSVGAALGGVAAIATTTAVGIASPPGLAQAAELRAAPHVMPSVTSAGGHRGGPPTRAPGVAPAPTPPGAGKEPDRSPAPRPADTTPAADNAPATSPEDSAPTGPEAAPAPDARPPAGGPPAPAAPSPSPPPSSPPPTAPPPPAPPSPPVPPPTPPPPAPNQAPSFAAGASQSVLEDAGAQTVSSWATAISPGAPSESSQSVTFTVTMENPGLFQVQPAVAPDGALTYAPAPDANGVSTVTVTARDDGGTQNGGDDTSTAATFMITVVSVNDAPSFTAGADRTAVSLLGAQSVPGWATGIKAGPANESSQSITFVVTTDRPNLFAVQPAVSPDGTLTFTPKLVAVGVATVTVRAVDSGGTTNGGQNSSSAQTFTITIL